MEQDLVKRVEALEKEVLDLRQELASIKNSVHIIQPKTVKQEKPLTKFISPEIMKKNRVGSVLTGGESTTTNAHYPDFADVEEKKKAKKPKKSFEDSFLALLPKIFMVIFVLGVLWGLKLASDYGILSDGVKIAGGFALAIVLAGIAYWADQNDKLKESLIVSLYGGSYIVGILTTAAGAIIYEVISLNVALIIALAFIVYGIAISYWKQKESLTMFVSFTSLLLPYLLDVMEFNPYLIASYTLILACALQIVIFKFKQKFAMYCSAFFAILALIYLANMNVDESFVMAFVILIVFGVLLLGWHKIVQETSKNYKAHVGLLFGFNFYALLGLIIIFDDANKAILVSIVMLAMQAAFALNAWRNKQRLVFDSVGAAIILTALYIILNLQVQDLVGVLFALVAAFVGLMVALRLRLSFMKCMYGIIFFILSVGVYVSQPIEGIFTLSHLLLLLVIVFTIVAFIYAKQNEAVEGGFAAFMKVVYAFEIVPLIIFAFIWSYILKLDEHILLFGTYEYGGSLRVLADILLLGIIALALVLPRKWVGLWLPILALTLFVCKSIMVHDTNWAYDGKFFEQSIVRALYLAMLIGLIFDIWKKGRIYRNFAQWIADILNWITFGLVLFLVYSVFGTTDFLEWNEKISWNIAVMTNTLAIFIAAIGSMIIGKRNNWKHVNYLGIGLLIFGFVKMIFFDLTNLDILVRSILFIVIGAVGLVVSNRLMKK